MSGVDPRNNLSWRVTVLEREVERIKEGKPDVIAERVTRLSADIDNLRRDVNDDMGGLRSEVASLRRILIGAFLTIATGLIIAIAVGNTGL